jgi:hypothetical protein
VLDTLRAAPIEGLWATWERSSVSLMGGNYPGAGITLGPNMTFGWMLGRHVPSWVKLATRPALRPQEQRHAA